MPKRLLTCFLDLLLVPAPEQAGDGRDAGHRALVADPLFDQPDEIRVHKLVPQFYARWQCAGVIMPMLFRTAWDGMGSS